METLRKYRGPATWMQVRLAYVAGESGPSVARRFDVGLFNLRKKSRREGWSRRHQAADADRVLNETLAAAARLLSPVLQAAGAPPGPVAPGPAAPSPPDPPPPAARPDAPGVRRDAIARAATLLAAGRAGEALTQLKAAEALARLATDEADAWAQDHYEAETEAARVKLGHIVEARAAELAEAMLAEGVQPGVRFGGHALRWRAETFGPGAAEADRRAAEAAGWAGRYWDAAGVLWPEGRGEGG